ncbi:MULTISPECIES: ABC transporter substrate-binding protein [unclassified Streptomyces]|uniref:Extracellular solute-binding protein n=1 Tax=Streptomyces sp. NBC_00119 TaxID=2975659 RepID=A0AAU1UIM2_9ACTN|nr:MULTISPECIES: extracellular solute-binding protein [unclassified Streptomyces]MCX4647947.1 extracellular solute-binding protein [Streptomyces sp. NBC_01446]MCX5320525.1 extracellular solute-binding protein [Streptomyces sp. NBC_00120]
MFRRRLTAMVCSVAALGLLATGCGGTDNGGSAAEKKTGEVTFWSFVKGSDKVAEAFNRTHPDIKVNFETVPSGQEYYSKLSNAVKAGTVPDVAVVEYPQLPEFATQGKLESLDGTLGPLVDKRFPQSTRKLVQLGGKTWGVPRDAAPLMLYYRNDFFKTHKIDVPKTWAEYRNMTERVKKADPKARGGVLYTDNPGLLSALTWQAGSQWFSTKKDAWKVSLDDAPSRKVADFWGDLARKDLVSSLSSLDPFWTSVQQNRTVAYVCASWCAGAQQATVADQKGKWAVAPVPTWDGKPASAMYGGSSFVVPKGAKNSGAAAEFIKWITTDPVGMKAWVSSGTSSMFPADPELVPVTKSAFPTDYFGGQDVYAVGSKSYDAVVPGWTWGPVMGTTNTAIIDQLPKVAEGNVKLSDVLTGAQKATVKDIQHRGMTLAP